MIRLVVLTGSVDGQDTRRDDQSATGGVEAQSGAYSAPQGAADQGLTDQIIGGRETTEGSDPASETGRSKFSLWLVTDESLTDAAGNEFLQNVGNFLLS